MCFSVHAVVLSGIIEVPYYVQQAMEEGLGGIQDVMYCHEPINKYGVLRT